MADTGDSHAPVPFFVSSRGYGLFVDTARQAQFYFGSHRHKRDVTAGKIKQRSPTSDLALLCGGEHGKLAEVIIDVPGVSGVDIYLFSGPKLDDAVRRYVLFSGGGCLPPMWALGMWYRYNYKFTQAEVAEVATQLLATHMPCDVLGLEPGSQTSAYPNTFEWDRAKFPNPAGLISDLANSGFRVNLWEHVYTHPESPLHKPLFNLSTEETVWGGLAPDLASQEARGIMSEFHRVQFVDHGVSGFKLDECDGSDFTGGWSFPEYSEFPSGVGGECMHNLLGVLYQRTIEDAFNNSGKRTFGSVRASGALSAPYPFALYSDLYGLEDYCRGVVNSGLAGLLWPPEVRQGLDREDLMRRMQVATFAATMQINGWAIRGLPWLERFQVWNGPGTPMPEAVAVTQSCRHLLQTRMRLVPYLYSALFEYHLRGQPPIRPLVMDFPDDPLAHEIDNQWIFGEAILVAPMMIGKVQREVYLPHCLWYDFWSGLMIRGGETHAVNEDVNHFPVFVRAGHIIPLADPVECVRSDSVFLITPHIYADPDKPVRSFSLYEDDGETRAANNGVYSVVTMKYSSADSLSICRSGSYSQHRYKFRESVVVGT